MNFFIWFLIWAWSFCSCYAQQFYDATLCTSDTTYPGTQYACSSFKKSCQTFLVYRANQEFQTISNISTFFNVVLDDLLALNNLTSSSQILDPGREVLVPINCSCNGQFFRANSSYSVHNNTTFSEIACGVYEGLVKSITLVEENLSQENIVKVGSMLHVPLKCACPDNNVSIFDGVKYLVTYPFVEGDSTNQVGKKFGTPTEDIWAANHLDSTSTVYPNTTILVPLKNEPFIHFDIPDYEPPTPGFLPTVPVEQTKNTKLKKLYIAGSVVGFSLVLLTLLACGLDVKAVKKWKAEKLHHFSARRSSMTSFSTPISSPLSIPTPRSSTNSCLSPDLLVGLKYTLCSYTTEEIREATSDFSEHTKISGYVFKGTIDNAEVIIKQMRFEDIRQVIDIHSKINHVNIMKLLGVCYGESDFSWSYLVFEHPANGSLRDCLLNSSNSNIRWHRRTQIAFDIAKGLHYLHYCMVPPHTHMSINTRNIFVTPNWRAKLAVSGTTPAVGCSNENEIMPSVGGWIAPEHLLDGLASEKVDIFAFGVVLLELMSAREDLEGRLFRESIGFLGGGASEGGCFEQLRNFMDPCLKEDYPLAEALCLAVLAKACVEDDPLHRPSMDDIIKVLARMV